MNNTIAAIQHIDIEKYSSIEEERQKVLSDKAFQQWCKDMKIGSRVEVKDYRDWETDRKSTRLNSSHRL